jgi:peptidoglycan/LPS O-acetylase OafA/YrhL
VPKFLVVLGDISYSLYLTHTFVITTFSKLILDIDSKVTIVSVIASVLAIAIAVGVAYFSWYLIENKLTDWIKIKLKK